MSNITPIRSIPTRPEQEIPITYDITKLEGGGVWVSARHPRMRTMTITVTPKGEQYQVRSWTITRTFCERDESGDPLWQLPELHQCVHGRRYDTLSEGIEAAKRVAEDELRQLRGWDFDDWLKEA